MGAERVVILAVITDSFGEAGKCSKRNRFGGNLGIERLISVGRKHECRSCPGSVVDGDVDAERMLPQEV